MRARDNGFSLIELVASLGVLALIAMLITAGVSTGRRVWDGLDNGAAAGESVQAAQAALRQALERTFPATRYDASAPYVDFSGAADGVEFLAPATDAAGASALRRYRLQLSSGDLVVASKSDVAADPDSAFGDEKVLLKGVQTLDIAYFGAAPTGGVTWVYRWISRPTPPQLVRVRVGFQPGDKRQWPELIVRPIANIDSTCVFEGDEGGCRGRS